jgi:hypothetical protein
LPVLAERGYLIPAIDTETTDYLACATQLADSIRAWHPDANITILTKEMLPHGDQGGFANDWQCFQASPYRQTIKLEADMVCASGIDHWWRMFEHRDLVISQGCRDYYDRPSTNRRYRKLFDDNNLPDVYNAITYWRLSTTAQEFFKLTRSIFENWEQFRTLLKFSDDTATTDVVYAMAAVIMGPEQVTLPLGLGPTIVHMKRHIISTKGENWTRELVWENTNPGLRINTVAQQGLVHYHNKQWSM